MLFHNVILRKLTSILRPWLQEEPDFELKIGLIDSLAIVKNLRFDVSVLNRIVDDSFQFSFEDFTVEHLAVRFSTWSAPAFSIEVRGIHVTLSARAIEQGNLRRTRTSHDGAAWEMKKVLSLIDPEGSSLHDILEKILAASSPRDKIKTSLLNLLLRHCCVRMLDVNIQVQFPVLNDSLVCMLKIKELNSLLGDSKHGSLVRGFLGAVLLPMNESSFTISGCGIEIGCKIDDHFRNFCVLDDLFVWIKLHDLQLVNLSIRIPELSLLFGPSDLPVLFGLGDLSSKDYNHARSGRQLWRVAAGRIGLVISSPILSLQNLVGVVILWLQYVNSYEYLLSLLRYPSEKLLKLSIIKISRNKMLLSSAKHRWETICKIERELPAEAVAQGRRVARYRARFNVQHADDSYEEASIYGCFYYLCKIFWLLAYIWMVVCKTFQSMAHLFSSRNMLSQEPEVEINERVDTEGLFPEFRSIINLEKVFINFCPWKAAYTTTKEQTTRIGHIFSDFVSLCFSVDEFLLIYAADVSDHSLSISCGQLKVESSNSGPTGSLKSSSTDLNSSIEGHKKWWGSNLKTILYVEPAESILHSEIDKGHDGGTNEGAGHLENFLREMWSNWNRDCMRLEEREIEYSESPCFLCETRSYLAFKDLDNQDSGFWKCSLVLGKLNIALGYSSILSIILLFNQIQCAQQWTADNERARVVSCSPRTNEDQQGIGSNNRFEFCSTKMKMAMQKKLPEKHIQVGIFVAGPHVQVSMEKVIDKEDVNDTVKRKDLDVVLDIHSIEFVVWPTSKRDLTMSKLLSRSDNRDSDQPWFPELRAVDIPKLDNEKYASRGCISLRSYMTFHGFDSSVYSVEEKQHSQIFVLKPVTICMSSLREYVYSFAEAVTGLANAVNGLSMGLFILSRMDDLDTFFQLVQRLSSALSHALNNFHAVGYSRDRGLMRSFVPVEYENEEVFAGKPLICPKTISTINATMKLKSLDMIIQASREDNKIEGFKELSDCGIWLSVLETSVEVAYEELGLQLHVDLCEFLSILFRHWDNIVRNFDLAIAKHLLLKSHNCLSEACFSSCNWTIFLDCSRDASALGSSGSTLGDSSTYRVENLLTANESETSSAQTHSFSKKLDFASKFSAPNSTNWIHVNLLLSDLLISRSSTKNVLVESHPSTKFSSSLSVGREFQSVSWGIQGGLFIIEPVSLVMFIQGFSSYLDRITSMVSMIQSSGAVPEKDEDELGTSGLDVPTQQVTSKSLEAFSIDVSQFALCFVGEDEAGGIRELVLEIDLHTGLEMANMKWRFVCEISRVSVISQILENVEREISIPHFSPASNKSSFSESEASLQALHHGHVICSDSNESVSTDFGSDASQDFYLGYKSCILKHLGVFVSVEKPENFPPQFNQAWVGGGSISGFDITISLPEFQMILLMFSSLSALSKGGKTNRSPRKRWSNNQETDKSFQAMVPDGAIVAIQDVHQHLYVTVEGGQNMHPLAGVLHYSLVGERALFKVKYHKQRRWRSSALWFTLTSLYAKNNKGVPLRLNYHPGSDLVGISGTYDNAATLWRTSFCKSESYKGDIDWEPFHKLVKNTFYLVNQKSDSAVAFIDGSPEFVRKPGNPFKFKVFQDISVVNNIAPLPHPEAHRDEGQMSMTTGNVPSINITVDGVAWTIVHELSETKDRIPLLRGSINFAQITVQMLSTKARIISISKTSVLYFDAQRNLWREFVRPVEASTFSRCTFQTQYSENALDRTPIHFYCRTGKWEISLTELSLDILLFVIGKLDLAGPFSVKSSAILANCCKVENHSGLHLLCHFGEKQTVAIGRNQAASIFLRYSAVANLSTEVSTVASVQLSSGSFTTSSIHLSLLEARKLAWRTRIVSLQDSRSHPGPFIVVDISRRSEDGLSISISPLIRFHNQTGLSVEIRFQRPEQKPDEFALVTMKPGDTIDDSVAAFDAISLPGGQRKTLTSLTVGNFSFSFRPETPEDVFKNQAPITVEWSEELKGGKPVCLSGVFDKLSYGVRRALSIESVKCSFHTAYCALKSEGAYVGDLHFLIQSVGRDVPIIQPDASNGQIENRNSPIALQEQREIFILPTVQVSHLLSSEAVILLTEMDGCTSSGCNNIGKQATVQYGSTVDFYVNPAIIYFGVTLTAFGSSCKAVNSGEWVKKLQKSKNDVKCLDVGLDFAGGKYCASLRLSRGERGILEAAVFTLYNLKNDSDCALFFFSPNQKPLSREDLEKYGQSIPPELGLYLPPKSMGSWFLRSHKVHVKLVDGRVVSKTSLDLDALSGLTEISLETEDESGVGYITKFGLYVRSTPSKMIVPSQIITIVPRHLVINESEEAIIVRQCYLEDDNAGVISIKSKQRTVLRLQNGFSKRRELRLFENFIKKHGNNKANPLIFIQFRLNEANSTWSGPLCIASIGCFFVKFRKHSSEDNDTEKTAVEFASVNVTEEGSTLTVRFHKPPSTPLPYRIENCLLSVSLTYYQKDSSALDVLRPGCRADYVWDDMTLPHKLVVIINDMHPLREVTLDKVRPWKLFFKGTRHRGLAATHFMLEEKSKDQRTTFGDFSNLEMAKVGYEVYADGLTRVLRISEFSDSRKEDQILHSRSKIQFRVSQLGICLLEHAKQNSDESPAVSQTPILAARLENIGLESVFTDLQKFNQICIQILQSLNMEQKWAGAPFAAMLRRHQSDSSDANDCLLKFVFVLLSSSSGVTQVKYSSMVLQPVDLNLDEETLMKIVPFWRTSLSTNSQSHQFYFDHFEIHPIKIIANFLPGDAYSGYNSAQGTLRTLLHSVVKVPPIKNMAVELNGVLVTHALITTRELLVRCAQHYSWYALRAIYIAKGSPLLPPAFASMFDDLASSSLDAFFDPSRGLVNLPGLTLGTFKLLSKCIDSKGFSGTKRYFGDLGKTLRTAGSNMVFAALTEISDSVLKGAEMKGFDGVVSGFHQGVLKLAMEPSLLGTALMEGGPDRTIKLDRSPGVDELYIEGYLQAMLDTVYRQEYLRVKVIEDQVFLKNLPPSNSLIEEIMDRVKGFLVSRGLLKGDPSTSSRPLRRLQGEREWKIGPTVLTLCEHLFVSYAIRILRKQAGKFISSIKPKNESDDVAKPDEGKQKVSFIWKLGIGKFVLSGIAAYIDGRLCRCIPNPIARRVVSGFLLTFLDQNDEQ